MRHGQSQDNVAPLFQSPDSCLNPKGREQASKIADRISKLKFAALLSSSLPRATETAEIIGQTTNCTPELSDLFVERIKPSSINGKLYNDAGASAVWRNWEKSLYTPGMRVEDGENFDDIVRRTDQALKLLKSRSEHSIVVVTHGYFLRSIIARVLLQDQLSGDAFREIQRLASMENTGLTVLRYSDAFEEKPCWRLWIYNDHAHLAE